MNQFQPKFDQITGLPIKATPAPVNTRTMLYHETRPAIIVEGKGDTDAERIADVARQIKDKKTAGYGTNRPHGQHPHSFDEHRMEHQRLSAQGGDKDAARALDAKAKLSAAKTVVAPVSDVASLQAQIAELSAKLEQLATKK